MNQDDGAPPKKSRKKIKNVITTQPQDYRDVKGKLVLAKNKHKNANLN